MNYFDLSESIGRKVPKRDSSGKTLHDFRKGKPVPVREKIGDTESISRKNQPTAEEIAAMRRRRSSMLSSVALCDNNHSISAVVPPPGGVGAGVFFNDRTFQFANDTAIYWYAVLPKTLGGNSRPLLYLTSSNHASRGCEALLSYQGTNSGVFRIWDWATPVQRDGSQFIVGIGYDDLANYLIDYQIEQAVFKSLYIANWTRQLSPGQWTNEVFSQPSRRNWKKALA